MAERRSPRNQVSLEIAIESWADPIENVSSLQVGLGLLFLFLLAFFCLCIAVAWRYYSPVIINFALKEQEERTRSNSDKDKQEKDKSKMVLRSAVTNLLSPFYCIPPLPNTAFLCSHCRPGVLLTSASSTFAGRTLGINR